jgi:Zn-dependent oligopeptidase
MRKNSELATRQAESAAKAEREALLTKNAEQAQRLKELEANLLLGKQDAESAVGNESFSAGLPEIQQSLDQNSTEAKPLQRHKIRTSAPCSTSSYATALQCIHCVHMARSKVYEQEIKQLDSEIVRIEKSLAQSK